MRTLRRVVDQARYLSSTLKERLVFNQVLLQQNRMVLYERY